MESLINKIKGEIENRNLRSTQRLFDICQKELAHSVDFEGHHRIYDVLETAVNLLLTEKFNNNFQANPPQTLMELEQLIDSLPTQSWRDKEQIEFQQFSTPPTLAFIMTQFIKPKKDLVALEPSAGTGSLAVWLRNVGFSVEVNEISPRRQQLLELLSFTPYKVNAEFINDLLDPKVKPDLILINPPFSTSAGRVRCRKPDFGYRHVESALMRLNSGGRMVCLLGAESSLKTNKGKLFWNGISKTYKIHCFLIVPRKAFYKYGTTFQTVITVIDKPALNETINSQKKNKPPVIEFNSLAEILRFSKSFR